MSHRSRVVTCWRERTRYHSDPTQLFNQLCCGKINTLLLESSEGDNKQQLESKIIIDSALRITATDNIVTITALTANGACLFNPLETIIPNSISVSGTNDQRIISFPKRPSAEYIEESERLILPSVFDCFRWLMQIIQTSSDQSTTPFFGGLLAYDLIHSFEDIPRQHSSIVCPDICFYLAESMVHMNHKNKTASLQMHIFSSHSVECNRLYARMRKLRKEIASPELIVLPIAPQKQLTVTGNMSDQEYTEIIDHMRIYIQQGEVFQIVPSRQFYCPCSHPLSAYHILKQNNPSPYMFFMHDAQFILFGASPESYLKYDSNSRIIELHPIAGTRPRGFYSDGTIDLDLDNRIELSLRTHRKELAEHLMLVDLARNDLAKVSLTNSRYVSQLMQVEKYSHVMHLVSRVKGILKQPLDIFHAYQSCMNMGTLTGAPKLRAMQLIAQLESIQRGAYGGSVGYFTGDGSLDACIVIRSAFIRKDIATIQSGAGIVYDSISEEEVKESKNKAQSVIQSIFYAHHMHTGKFYV